MLENLDVSAGRVASEAEHAAPERSVRLNPPRAASEPPPENPKERVYPLSFRTLTREDVLDILQICGPSTRSQMFEHVFGPTHLAACDNPSSYAHKAVKALERDQRILSTGSEGRSKIYRLAETTGGDLPPAGLFAHAGDQPTSPEPAWAPSPGGAGRDRSAARVFVEDVVQGSIKIPFVDTDAAEALVAGIFDDPHAPLPEAALVAGWRSDLADMAYASSAALRASRFAGLDPVAAETAFNEVVQGYALGPTDLGPALRLVLVALSGPDGEGPGNFAHAWMADAFAQLRSPPISDAPAAPAPATEPARRPRSPRQYARERKALPPSPPKSPSLAPERPSLSEILKAKALADFEPGSPVDRILSRYAPMIRLAMDAGATPEEIAERFVTEGGMQIPGEMAVLLIRRVYGYER
jgi:hypothetical protein